MDKKIKQIHDELVPFRRRFAKDIKYASKQDPKRRKQIYQQWREHYGDIVARQRAKYTEAFIKGYVVIVGCTNGNSVISVVGFVVESLVGS